jgi:hypothetical protein
MIFFRLCRLVFLAHMFSTPTKYVHRNNSSERVPFASRPLQERCPPRQKSRVERIKAKVEPLLT